MNNEILIAVLAGLGGMFGWGFSDFFAKKTIDKVGEVVSLVWAHFFGVCLFILFALYKDIFVGSLNFPSDFKIWLGLILFGILQMVVYWLVYKGFSKGQLVVLNPVFASYSGIVVLVSILFFGENLSLSLMFALIGIFIGIIFLNSDLETLRRRRIKITPGLKEVGLASILAALWTLGWGKFVSGKDYLAYTLIMYCFMALSAILLAHILKVNLFKIKENVWKFFVLIGISEAIAYLSISIGFSKTDHIGIVAVISGSFSLPAALLAYYFLGERITKMQTIAIAVIIMSIAIISIS